MPDEPVKPPALSIGDRVAIVATSWGAGAHLPERCGGAHGPRIRTSSHAQLKGRHRRNARLGVGHCRTTLGDFHEAFDDPSVRAVLSVIGGDHSAQMLPGLDFHLVAMNPKVFCGYSDTTSLLHAVHQVTGLVTFYGPALVPEFGEPGGPDPEVVDHWCKVTGLTEPAGALPRVEAPLLTIPIGIQGSIDGLDLSIDEAAVHSDHAGVVPVDVV